MTDQDEVELDLVGAYARVEQPNADEEVQKAAQFAVSKLLASPKYSFADALGADAELKATVVKGYAQVVAGMNYKLTILLSDKSENYVGAFEVLVYDHFGDMSVDDWGKEVPCDEAKAMLIEDSKN